MSVDKNKTWLKTEIINDFLSRDAQVYIRHLFKYRRDKVVFEDRLNIRLDDFLKTCMILKALGVTFFIRKSFITIIFSFVIFEPGSHKAAP